MNKLTEALLNGDGLANTPEELIDQVRAAFQERGIDPPEEAFSVERNGIGDVVLKSGAWSIGANNLQAAVAEVAELFNGEISLGEVRFPPPDPYRDSGPPRGAMR